MILDEKRTGGVRPWDAPGFDPTKGGPFYKPDPDAPKQPGRPMGFGGAAQPVAGTPAATPPRAGTPGGGLSSKLQSKGITPNAPAGPQGSLPPWLQNVAAGQGSPNGQTNAQGAASGDWLKKVAAGTDAFGGTNQTRAAGGAAAPPGEVTEDWQSVLRKISGQPNADPLALLQQAHAQSRQPGQGNSWPNMRRMLTSSGLDPKMAVKIEEAFGSGASAEEAAAALGMLDKFKAGGQLGLRTIG
jgi:hypothetical protein